MLGLVEKKFQIKKLDEVSVVSGGDLLTVRVE
jgi:hypothetical protein